MNINPIYKRENRVLSRSTRLPLILVVFGSVLALVALLNMYSTLAQVRVSATIQYSGFFDLYTFVAILEFFMLLLIMPAITAGCISGEREKQTLELMLTTRVTPARIVLGKFASAGSTMMLLILSGFPILAMVFVYGGITVNDILLLLLCFFTIAVYVGSIGMLCSAFSKTTTTATIATYAIEFVLLGGTYALNQFIVSLSKIQVGNMGESMSAGGQTGASAYLLVLNPATTFINMLYGTVGIDQIPEGLLNWFGSQTENVVTNHWMMASMVMQWTLSFAMILLAIRQVHPRNALNLRIKEK